MIHLIVGPAAAGLKHSFKRKGHEVIGLPIDLSVGPLQDMLQKNERPPYFDWIEQHFDAFWHFREEEQLTKQYVEAIARIEAIESGAEITLWTSNNANEQIGLRLFCYLLRDKSVNLHVVNTYEAMKKVKEMMSIRHSGECIPEDLVHFFKHNRQALSIEQSTQLANEAENLLTWTGKFRLWENGDIIPVAESNYDDFILKCAARLHEELGAGTFLLSFRSIGEVLGESEQNLSDAWIEYRIGSLIDQGLLLKKRQGKSYAVKIAKGGKET